MFICRLHRFVRWEVFGRIVPLPGFFRESDSSMSRLHRFVERKLCHFRGKQLRAGVDELRHRTREVFRRNRIMALDPPFLERNLGVECAESTAREVGGIVFEHGKIDNRGRGRSRSVGALRRAHLVKDVFGLRNRAERVLCCRKIDLMKKKRERRTKIFIFESSVRPHPSDPIAAYS